MSPVSAIPGTPEPDGPPPSRPRRWWIATAVAGVIAVGVIVGAVVTSRDETPTRQDLVAERGAQVMPFDLDATTHVFDPTDVGGVQRVVADDPADRDQVELIRTHLLAEVARFRNGDFGDPATIHGHDMPGLTVLEANASALDITYRDLDDGAEVTYRSADADVVAALHEWFAAQLSDHDGHAEHG